MMEGDRMLSVDLSYNHVTERMIKKAAWRLKVKKAKAIRILFSRGLDSYEKAVQKWEKDTEKSGESDRMQALHSEKVELTRELIEIESKIVSNKFASYIEFNLTSNALIAYSGRRGQANILRSKLAEQDIQYDLSTGDVPNYDDLVARYLFHSEQGENGEVARHLAGSVKDP